MWPTAHFSVDFEIHTLRNVGVYEAYSEPSLESSDTHVADPFQDVWNSVFNYPVIVTVFHYYASAESGTKWVELTVDSP